VSGALEPGAPVRPARPPGSQVLFTGAQIAAAVDRLAGEIRAVYGDEELTVVAVLHGGLVFAADLMRRLDMPVRLGVVLASSYRGPSTEPGELQVQFNPELQLRGRHVLLLDDILDTGRTLMRLRDELRMHGPRSLRLAALLDKPSRRVVPLHADFVGFSIPDVFVVGYGLDWNERWRNLPDIVALPAGTGG
jgi:hypoxanthine phosphoribosyltransferase